MKPVNYNCPNCKLSGKLPNIAGKFLIISDNMCKCNGCNGIFEKNKYFKVIVDNAKLYTE
jgi:hypothetical protein